MLGNAFPEVTPHKCLEHSKKDVAQYAGPGYKQLVSNSTGWQAFLPPALFSECLDLQIDKFSKAGQANLVHYMQNSGYYATLEGDIWTAPWKSSYVETRPG